MNQLTQEQIKTLKDVFESYPKDFKPSTMVPLYATMEGIEKQLQTTKEGELSVIFYITPDEKNMEIDEYAFNINKMIIGEIK